jgi:hypothetical protein
MGWASAGAIFDPVAKAMVELRAPDEMKIRVLGDLIGALQNGDWDTESESLGEFQDDPAIVEAFRQHDVIIHCGAESDVGECELERGHEGDHEDWQHRRWASTDPGPEARGSTEGSEA